MSASRQDRYANPRPIDAQRVVIRGCKKKTPAVSGWRSMAYAISGDLLRAGDQPVASPSELGSQRAVFGFIARRSGVRSTSFQAKSKTT